MTSALKSKASASINKGTTSAFYSNDQNNPVLLALENEVKQFCSSVKKKSLPGFKEQPGENLSRSADTLFDLWNRYEAKLDEIYYQKKLLEVGDFLMSMKEYSLALWQCYDRYLQHFGDINMEKITDVEIFKECFFPNGLSQENTGLTFRALMGKSISMYYVVKMNDCKLQNRESVDRCVHILSFLRLVTQVILPKETLCWLIFNGTVHIYTISRHLMSLGHSAKVLEYVLWASMCMETSVPLLVVKYLPWRSTLYAAVCQCYFDCKMSQHAEAFARRGLAKVNELSQLESMSSSPESQETEIAFRQATIKMAVMVYKRTVFETRRKPKGLLRPKTRANLKDAQNLPWPRTPTEKMLVDMFEGSSAQFLAILESLKNSNRRILVTSSPAPESDVEILDVYAELFMAAQEIMSGSYGGRPRIPGTMGISSLGGVVKGRSLIEMAANGEDGVPIEAVIRLVKLAYSFEQWDAFDTMVDNVLAYIRINDDDQYAWDEKALEILLAMEKLNSSRKQKRQVNVAEDDGIEPTNSDHAIHPPPSTAGQSMKSLILNDELIQMAEILMSVVSGAFLPEKIEIDIIVDAALFIWNKCKAVFQKYQTGSVDNPKYLHKMENPNKWIYLLEIVHKVLCWCGIGSVDPALTSEVVLRLALVLESSAYLDQEGKVPKFRGGQTSNGVTPRPAAQTGNIDSRSAMKESKTTLSDVGLNPESAPPPQSRQGMFSSLTNVNGRDQLLQARDILQLGLENVSFARQAVAVTDGKSIADVSWAKYEDLFGNKWELNTELFDPEIINELTSLSEDGQLHLEELIPKSLKGSATAVWNTIKDLHLELILMYHRVCLKLTAMGPDPAMHVSKSAKRTPSKVPQESPRKQSYAEDFDELAAGCNKNNLSKVLLYMQKSLMYGCDGLANSEQRKYLDEAVTFIQKAQTEEKKLFVDNAGVLNTGEKPRKCPPPPTLLCRTDTMMVFKPAPFLPENGEKVAWYRVFARSSSGSNVRVRLNDYRFPGAGQQVPAFHCELKVCGLTPNERYVFAVAAYTSDGKLIGDTIGDSTRPVLAIHPLPVLMTWAFLSQVAYQVGYYQVTQQACQVLWDHFVSETPKPKGSTYITTSKKDLSVTLFRLNQRIVCLTSPVLLRQFLSSIFIGVDISVREGELFCDTLCDKGPSYNKQMKRLGECEKMLVAMELAGWLNESNLALQAVVQCYGLLAPLIFYKIPSTAVIQILQKCHAVLQEIPPGLRQKRQSNIADSLHHLCACITFHMAKVLRTWGQKTLANNINDAGRRLLSTIEGDGLAKQDVGDKVGDKTDGTVPPEGVVEVGSNAIQALKKKKFKKGSQAHKEEPEGPVNEELKALEAHILSLTKQAQSEHELTGNEDPSILHAYIAYLPSRIGYREVQKFKRRARYLEFFVQVAQKALSEGSSDSTVEWCDETLMWLTKRNEGIIGARAFLSKQPGVITVSGDDPERFAAAMVEYSKEKESAAPKAKPSPNKTAFRNRRKKQYRPLLVNANMSDAAKQAQEEKELMALDRLTASFPDMLNSWARRKKLRKICIDEMPWRCQLNMLQGMSHFTSFLQKLERREKVLGSIGSSMFKTSFLDHEWFAFETAGTLVVGWEGGPARQVTRQSSFPDEQLQKENTDALDLAVDLERQRTQTTHTGLEIAAALATGAPPPPSYIVPPEHHETPRTYRSDISTVKPDHSKPDPDLSPLSTEATIEALTKTFAYFSRAATLAHRGSHWTLLQNACRALWNCAHTALLRTLTNSNSMSQDAGLVTYEVLRSLLLKPFYMATDCLLDMIAELEVDLENCAGKAKSKGKNLGDYFESWMGDIKNEKGGAGLKFEEPLDDATVVDMRWVRRMTLRLLEMLYHEQKWEKLVHIALKFSALTNDRYAEQVIPLLVQSQRKLTSRIKELGGTEPPQPHFILLSQQLQGVITAKTYLHAQLKLSLDKERLPKLEPGAQLDPEGHNAYKAEDAQKNVSVPLDTRQSLTTLRGMLDQSQYTARALQHSRQLLVLYLAGQQNIGGEGVSRLPSRVEFLSTTDEPKPTMAPDISGEEYLYSSDVQSLPIPKSQLGTVVMSYEKSIDMLMAKKQRGLAAQAMHELGNLHLHASNLRGAYRWWIEALDVVLNTTDSLHKWTEMVPEEADISSELLKLCGLWGCLLGGQLTSNIAQYILTSDLGLRTECCFLSAYFFKALFRSSLPHPLSDRDYALYEVGEGCEVTNLVPGVDLFSDRFRCDGRQIVAALRFVTEELSRGRHNLFVLPLLTLNQYLTTFVCRDLQRSVDGRILKIRVLTDLGLYSEAFITLQRLLHGERIPHIGDSTFRQVESKMSSVRFDTSKPILEQCNLKVLENVIDKRLSSSLATLYGPYLTCHLTMVQAHLLISVAETIPVLPVPQEEMALLLKVESEEMGDRQSFLRVHTISTISRGGLGGKGPKLSQHSSNKHMLRSSVDEPVKGDDEGASEDSVFGIKRFTGSKKPVTLEMVKSTILAITDQMTSTMSEVIQENAEQEKKGLDGLSSAELELVVLCKLKQANISLQKQHAPMAARIVLSALKLLQCSEIFRAKKYPSPPPRPSSMKGRRNSTRKIVQAEIRLTDVENSQYQFQNFQSRSRLDARLWLECRLILVKSLLMEIRGMGDVKGESNKVLSELADCRQYCAEGLNEAEACGDKEMEAEFYIQGVYLNIMEGKSLEHTTSLIQDAVQLLRLTRLSVPGKQLLATCLILKTDLQAVEESNTQFLLDEYHSAQDIVLQQLQDLGESIEHFQPDHQRKHHNSPVSPVNNLYLPQLSRLVQIKLRVGQTLARNIAKQIKTGALSGDLSEQWTEPLSVLLSALNISQITATREANLEAEILLNIGKVQRMLTYIGKYQARAAAATLLEAIKISFASDHDLGLIRQAYLEIALIYLHSSGLLTMREYSSLETLQDIGVDESQSEGGKTPKKKWTSKKEKARLKSKEEDVGDQEKERRAAWLAIRCASAVAQAQRARLLLIGDMEVTSQKPTDKSRKEMPEFLALDLVSVYVLGEKKKVYKSEIEEELAALVEAQEEKHSETYDEKINKARIAAGELNWIHLLGYQTILQRLCSTATISASSAKKDPKTATGDLGSGFDLGFISHAQIDASQTQNSVRSMLFSGPWSLRLSHLHKYFSTNLTSYANNCCAIYPPGGLSLPVPSSSSFLKELNIFARNYEGNLTTPQDAEGENAPPSAENARKPPPPPGVNPEPLKPSDKDVITSTADTEICLQWYYPSLEEHDAMRVEISGLDSKIILLYALSKKGSAGIQTGFLWVPSSQISDLHDRLAVLMQRGEVSIPEKPKTKDQTLTPPQVKSKKAQRIKPLSPKIQKDEKLEALLKQCLDDCASVFGIMMEQDAGSPLIPFEVTRVNIQTLEKLFDPSFGYTVKGTDVAQWLMKLV